MDAGLSLPIGEKITVRAKSGFEREKSEKHTTETTTDDTHFTALHDLPIMQINLNETTVQLSPDAEADIKKLRKGRNFSDLLSFFKKYG